MTIPVTEPDSSNQQPAGTDPGAQQPATAPTKPAAESFNAEEERKRLRRQIEQELKAEQARKQAQEQGNFQKLYEDLQKDLEATRKQLEEKDLELVRIRVASKHNLSLDQAARLRGSSEEELDQDAKDLIKLFGLDTKKDKQEPQPEAPFMGTPEGYPDKPGSQVDKTTEHMQLLLRSGEYAL